jgi:inhibitor of KinA
VSDVTPTLTPVADHGLLVSFGDEITDEILARVHALDRAVADARPAGLVELVPAPTSLLVVFDATVTDHDAIAGVVAECAVHRHAVTAGRVHVIDVCYDEAYAPDLPLVAERTGLSPHAVIEAHRSATYTVGAYGFAPGYAYLYGTPPAIQLPRNPTPGPIVPAGSVIIAGQQCIVIPIAMSTGWYALGRSPARMLTGDERQPFLVDVGDTVTFRPIGVDELLDRLAEHGAREVR